MPIFEYDFPRLAGTNTADIKKLLTTVDRWTRSDFYKSVIVGRDYFLGDNTTIKNVEKYYYSDPRPKLSKSTGLPELDLTGKPIMVGGGWVKNPYVANNHIGYGVFADIVSQKVNTLLDEPPRIDHQAL